MIKSGFGSYLPALLWSAIIFLFSTTNGVQLPESILAPDKIGHFCSYGLLNWLILRALRKTDRLTGVTTMVTLVGTSMYGVALEYVQLVFFPERYFEVWDMLANFTGSLASLFVYKIFYN